MMKAALALVDHGSWTLIGMLIFLAVFATLVYRTYGMNQQSIDDLASLPFRDEKDLL